MVLTVVGKVDAVLRLTFKWEVENFSISCNTVGDGLESPKFTAKTGSSDIQWHLRLYPKGDEEKNKDYLTLFLYADTEVTATADFKILNNRGKVVIEKSDKLYALYGTSDGGWGYDQFVSRNFVVNPLNSILNDDKLTIVCEITYYKNTQLKCKDSDRENEEKEHDALPRLEDEYEALVDDGKFSDAVLISEGKTVKVHKCILAKRSSVFAAMFDADMKERQESTVEIADIKYNVLVEMVRFVYAGKVNNIDALASELAVAADKYALDGLKNTCEKTMSKNLNLDNVIDHLQLADRIRMANLKKKAIEFIVGNASVVGVKPEFKLLSTDILSEVFCCLAEKK